MKNVERNEAALKALALHGDLSIYAVVLGGRQAAQQSLERGLADAKAALARFEAGGDPAA